MQDQPATSAVNVVDVPDNVSQVVYPDATFEYNLTDLTDGYTYSISVITISISYEWMNDFYFRQQGP